MFAPSSHLDNQYTIWGQVTEGMDLIDGLKRGEGSGGTVRNPDRIVSMKLAEPAPAPALEPAPEPAPSPETQERDPA